MPPGRSCHIVFSMILIAPPSDLQRRRIMAEMLRQHAAAMPAGWGRQRYEAYAAELDGTTREVTGALSPPAFR